MKVVVRAILLNAQRQSVTPQPISVHIFSDGGYFAMPQLRVRPGKFILVVPGQADRVIRVNATSHKAVYFKFVKQ